MCLQSVNYKKLQGAIRQTKQQSTGKNKADEPRETGNNVNQTELTNEASSKEVR